MDESSPWSCPARQPPAASPELLDRPPRRRRFTATDKLRILAEIDRAGPGLGGAILRREELYSSALTELASPARRRRL